MTTILSLLYRHCHYAWRYGIWGALLGRYETRRVAPLSLAIARGRAGELPQCCSGNVDRDATCGRSTDYGWTHINVFGFRVRRTARRG